MCCCLLDGKFTHFLQKAGVAQVNWSNSPSDVVSVVLLGGIHAVVVKLPPRFGALSGPLCVFWKSESILVLWTECVDRR